MDSVSGVGVVDKSVAVLQALAERGPLGLAELTAATGLSRPTAHRLARALETHGLVGRDGQGRFRLGLRLLAWGAQAAADTEALVDAARSLLAELRDATGESAQLYVRDDDRRVCVATAERRTGLRDTVPVGAALSLCAGSGARVLVAWSPDGDCFGFDPSELAAVRLRGWATTVGEREAGVASVSAPVRSPNGEVVAAIGVSGPADRFEGASARRLAGPVVDAARKLGARLG